MQDKRFEAIVNRHRMVVSGYHVSRGDVEYLIRKIEHYEAVITRMSERACDMVESIEVITEFQDALLEIKDDL